MRKVASGLLVIVGVCALSGMFMPTSAADQGITGKKLLLKGTPKVVLISKDPGINILGSDPVGGSDSSITFEDGTNSMTFNLPKTGWSTNSSTTLFKYKNAAAPAGPSVVKIVKLKPGLLKIVAYGLPFAVPNGASTIDVVLTLDGGTNTYCMTFSGTGDGDKFLVKDTVAGHCNVCGDNARGDAEECDGTDDASCPALCKPDCTCDLTAPACCQFPGSCGGGVAGFCVYFGGTPVGGGAVCGSEGSCSSPPVSSGPCCQMSSPILACDTATDHAACEGLGRTYHPASTCLPSGQCLSECDATTGGFCWFLGTPGASCDAVCTSNGKVYDTATETYAGSGGTDANCIAVLDDLGVPSYPLLSTSCTDGFGCGFRNTLYPRFRCIAPATNGSATYNVGERACACQ